MIVSSLFSVVDFSWSSFRALDASLQYEADSKSGQALGGGKTALHYAAQHDRFEVMTTHYLQPRMLVQFLFHQVQTTERVCFHKCLRKALSPISLDCMRAHLLVTIAMMKE